MTGLFDFLYQYLQYQRQTRPGASLPETFLENIPIRTTVVGSPTKGGEASVVAAESGAGMLEAALLPSRRREGCV